MSVALATQSLGEGEPLEIDVAKKRGALHIELSVPGRWTGIWCGDPFRYSETKRPRMAQKILRAGSLEDLHKHITSGNIAYLTNVPGVGKKTAQKIVLELQGVLVTDVEDGGSVQDQDTLDALMSLGYSRGDAAETIKQLTSASTAERIKEALQLLGRR